MKELGGPVALNLANAYVRLRVFLPTQTRIQSKNTIKTRWPSRCILAGLIGLLSPIASLADGSEKPESPCETVWVDIVEQVRPYGPSLLPPKNGIVFVGNDGQAYDCLNMGIPNQLLETSSMRDGQFFDLVMRRKGRDYFMSISCGAGFKEFEGNSWVTIYLPYEVEQLSSQTCRQRIPAVFEALEEAIGE